MYMLGQDDAVALSLKFQSEITHCSSIGSMLNLKMIV